MQVGLEFFPGLGGGDRWPTANQNNIFAGTKCQIDLQPGYKFEFIRCPEVFLNKMINLVL